MSSSIERPEVYRNMGFWNDNTQEAIADTTVAIGGAGGAGYMFGLELARIGVENIIIADPEDFDTVNSNRVFGVRKDTIGRNKAEVFQEDVMAINDRANVTVYNMGINADNVEEFMRPADMILDATELSMPELGTMIAREARKTGKPVINVEYVAHAGQGTSFNPNSRMTFEKFMGIKGGEDAPLDEVADQTISPSRYLAYIPPYADLATLEAINSGAPLPSNMIGAGQAAQIGVAEALKHIRQRVGEKGRTPVYAPEVRWMDAYTGKAGTTSHPRLSFYKGIAKSLVRKQMGLYEPSSYTPEQRAARGDVSSH